MVQGQVAWESAVVALSVAFALAGATGALMLAGQARHLKRQALGAASLTAGFLGLHYGGMSAMTITPDAAAFVPDQLLSGEVMTLAVASITSLIILGGLVATTDDVPHGLGLLASAWGKQLQTAVWSTLMGLANDHASERSLTPRGLAATAGQLHLAAGKALTQARGGRA